MYSCVHPEILQDHGRCCVTGEYSGEPCSNINKELQCTRGELGTPQVTGVLKVMVDIARGEDEGEVGALRSDVEELKLQHACYGSGGVHGA